MGTLIVNEKGQSPIFALREKKRNDVINSLTIDINRLRKTDPDLKLWLIGSYAAGNWDTYSDIDVVCVSSREYHESDFQISNQFPMDIFSLDAANFERRMNGDVLFKKSVDDGVRL